MASRRYDRLKVTSCLVQRSKIFHLWENVTRNNEQEWKKSNLCIFIIIVSCFCLVLSCWFSRKSEDDFMVRGKSQLIFRQVDVDLLGRFGYVRQFRFQLFLSASTQQNSFLCLPKDSLNCLEHIRFLCDLWPSLVHSHFFLFFFVLLAAECRPFWLAPQLANRRRRCFCGLLQDYNAKVLLRKNFFIWDFYFFYF